MTADKNPAADPIAYLTREFTRNGNRIAARLRQAADDVERHAATIRTDIHDLKLDHQYSASEILHDIQTMYANLPLGGLLKAASDADRYVRNPEGVEGS